MRYLRTASDLVTRQRPVADAVGRRIMPYMNEVVAIGVDDAIGVVPLTVETAPGNHPSGS